MTGQRREEVARHDMGRDRARPVSLDYSGKPSKERCRARGPLSPQAQAVLRAAPRVKPKADGLRETSSSLAEPGLFRLEQIESPSGRPQRGERVALHDLRRTTSNGAAKARRAARGDRKRFEPRLGQPRRYRWRLSAPRMGRGEAGGAQRLGEHVAAIVEGRTAADNGSRLRRSA